VIYLVICDLSRDLVIGLKLTSRAYTSRCSPAAR